MMQSGWNVFAFKVSERSYFVPFDCWFLKVFGQYMCEFVTAPHIEVAFVAVSAVVERVGIFCTEEPTVTMCEFAQHILNGFASNLLPGFITEQHPCVQIDAGEKCLVVEHFFKVGHQPHFINAVAREAATDVVVHTATGHGIERSSDDVFQIVIFTRKQLTQ